MTTDSIRAGFEFAVRFVRAQNDQALFASATAALAELAKIDAAPTAKDSSLLQRFATSTCLLRQEGGRWSMERRPLQVQGYREDLGEGLALSMVKIPAGSFRIGSPEDEPERSDDEGPQHEVTLDAFWMAKTPITQTQWRTVASWPRVEFDLDPDPSRFKGANRPVEQVSWFDAMEFCRRLSQRTGERYTLPSEAQWEYACRAGTTTPFHFGDTLTPKLANYDGNYSYENGPKGIYREQTTDVASFPANSWGLHDMHGNVWEWCLDEWHDSYEGAPTDGSAWMEDDSLGESPAACCAAGRGSTPQGTAARLAAAATTRTTATSSSVSASVVSSTSDASRLLRGGSWLFIPRYCRSAYRYFIHPVNRNYGIGFRVCCLPQD